VGNVIFIFPAFYDRPFRKEQVFVNPETIVAIVKTENTPLWKPPIKLGSSAREKWFITVMLIN
jgi:hypothetical protein